jgi:hypothetical protein
MKVVSQFGQKCQKEGDNHAGKTVKGRKQLKAVEAIDKQVIN